MRFLTLFFCTISTLSVETKWTHSEILDNCGNIILRWQLLDDEIIFRVEAKTTGYIVLKLSLDGKREHSDIIIGWIDRNMKASLMDCHGDKTAAPVLDKITNYVLLEGNQNETHTVLEFKRALDTCDPEDYPITEETVMVVWVLHDKDPFGSFESDYHESQKGVQSVQFLAPPRIPKPRNFTISEWDLTINNTKSRKFKTTWAKIFKPPFLEKTNHIIGYEPVIGSKHSLHIHHMFLYECKTKKPETCFSKLIVWIVGNAGEFFPDDFGLVLSSTNYYLLEMHFNKPIRSVESTGLRLYYTSKLRRHEGGIFEIGITRSSLHFIPSHQEEYKTAGFCSSNCTKAAISEKGVQIVAVIFQGSVAAKKMRLRHVRDGKELVSLAENNNYDANYDRYKISVRNNTVLPGDGLILECSYSTISREEASFGGFGLNNEMCLAYLYHYPKTGLNKCYSHPPIEDFFETFGVEEFYNFDLERLDELVIEKPKKLQNQSFMGYLQKLHFNDSVSRNLEKKFYFGKHSTYCKNRDDLLINGEIIIQPLPNFTIYGNNRSNRCTLSSSSSVLIKSTFSSIFLFVGSLYFLLTI